jgi:hypothetical protein
MGCDFNTMASSCRYWAITGERIWAYATIENLQSKMDYFGADKDTEDAITDLVTE